MIILTSFKKKNLIVAKDCKTKTKRFVTTKD